MWQIQKNKVRKIMYEKDLTTDELAKALGFSRVTLINMLHNHHRVSIDKALDLADTLNVSIYDIVKKI